MSIKILFHDKCPDGSLAAYTAWLKFGKDATYIPRSYYDNYVETIDEGDTVYLLDFCVDRKLLLDWYDRAESLLVLDHHVTAEKEVGDLHFVQIDKNECGATLAWKHFFPNKVMPKVYNYVRDRDLWLWEQPHTKEINAFIGYRRDMNDSMFEWQRILSWIEMEFEGCVDTGFTLNKQREGYVKRLVEYAAPLQVGHYTVPSVNSSIFMSEIAHQLLAEYPDAPFSCVYTIQNGKLRCSLRSEEGRADVSQVAEIYSGGGHVYAAGCSFVPQDWSQIGVRYETT